MPAIACVSDSATRRGVCLVYGSIVGTPSASAIWCRSVSCCPHLKMLSDVNTFSAAPVATGLPHSGSRAWILGNATRGQHSSRNHFAVYRGAVQLLSTAQLEPPAIQSPPQVLPETSLPSLDADEHPKFQWAKAWYPVAQTLALDGNAVNKTQLLGQSLVLFKDANQQWKAAQDLCPHRLVPMSEGRRESDGTLNCAYHGWRFDGDGKCVHIPQLTDKAAEQRAISSSRACLTTFPAQERLGLLWVWPTSGPEAFIEAFATEPCVPSEHVEAKPEDIIWLSSWYIRDVPYGFDFLAENVLDPSHVAHSHHGVLGHRQNVIQHDIRLKEMTPGGFSAEWSQQVLQLANGKSQNRPANRVAAVEFAAPCRATTRFNSAMGMHTYATPVAPGRSRLFFCLTRPAEGAPKAMTRMLPLLNPPWMLWKSHLRQMEVLDGDNRFLHLQEHEARKRSGNLARHYYTPAPSDGAVNALRRWFFQHGGEVPWAGSGQVPSLPGLPEPEQKRLLLERWNSHTSTCPHCSKAFAVFTAIQRMCMVAAAVATFWATACAAGGLGLRSPRFTLAVLAAIAGAAASWAMEQLRQRFIFVDYVHQHHN